MRLRLASLLLVVAGTLSGCAGPRGGDGPPSAVPGGSLPDDPVPRAEPRSRYGNPPSYEVFGRRYHVMATSRGYRERGVASWYGTKFHGRRTSSGETYDMYKMTAAHRTLPLPTYVLVTNLQNGRRVVVRVNDRGPFHDNRIIDLSYSAARKLDIVANGTGLVEVRTVGPGDSPQQSVIRTSSAAPIGQPVAAILHEAVPEAATGAPPRIFLQVGAFADRTNAERLRTRLLSIVNRSVDVTPIVQGSLTMHRVRIGPLPDVSSADSLSQRILDSGMDLPRIVVE